MTPCTHAPNGTRRHALKVKERAPQGQNITVETIGDCGHQVFLDQPDAFENVVMRLCGIKNPKPAPPAPAQQLDATVMECKAPVLPSA